VGQRDNPELRGKPLAVGGSRERGVVAAASYDARKFGVWSAMPSVTARRKCSDLIFVKPRFGVYREVSLQIRAILAEHTLIIEPLSLEEAYLDVTKNLRGIASATEIAEQIGAKIRAETELTASAGVSYNKFLAKLASDYRKPDGLFVITPAMGPSFVEALPVERFHGVGPATAAKMKELEIFTAFDLRAKDEAFLLKLRLICGYDLGEPKSITCRSDFGPLNNGINQRGVANGSVSPAESSTAHRRVTLFAEP
jgi:DNA polymerase-4